MMSVTNKPFMLSVILLIVMAPLNGWISNYASVYDVLNKLLTDSLSCLVDLGLLAA
jgi:hypothetical protein